MSDAVTSEPSTRAEPGGIAGMARAADARFAIASVAVPLGLLAVALAAGDAALMNFVHVLSGALWLGFTVFLVVVFGPTMARASPEARGQIAMAMTPKTVFLLPAVAVTALVSGPALAVWFGYWDLSDPVLVAALSLAAVALVIGLLILRLQLRVYAELRSPPPDPALLGRLAGRNAIYGLVQTVVLFAVVAVMAAMRTGLSAA